MPSSFRYVAPAGAPIHVTDLVAAVGRSMTARDVRAELAASIRQRFGVRHAFPTSTGRAGLTLLLRALRQQGVAGRDEVIVPAYTCYSVAASIVKAGLRPRVMDIDPATLDYQFDRLDQERFDRVLAIVACNLYGYPSDVSELRRLTRRHGVFVVDDAAQAMGANLAGVWSGTAGDFGLYSFDKGKNVSAIDGGVVVTNDDDLAAAYQREQRSLGQPHVRDQASELVKASIYSLFLRPSLYWIPNRIPQLGLGKTVFTTEFPLDHPGRLLAALATRVLPRVDTLTQIRAANAAALIAELRTIQGVTLVTARADAAAAFLRLPILLPNQELRNRVLDALSAHGIGASASYPSSLADVPELQGVAIVAAAAGGREVARRILTLPTHPFVAAQDIRRIAAVVRAQLAPEPLRQASSAA